jgi:hypothetical protein
MNPTINLKLEQAQQGVARLRKVDAMLDQLKLEQVELGRRRCELKAILARENEDVAKLEHTSLASLFYAALGRREEQVDKERQEALAAKLKLDQAEKDLADVQARIAELAAERTRYLHCPQEFAALYAQKKEELLRDNGEAAQAILALVDEQNRARINLREINEAIAVGEEVLGSLEMAEQSLDKAGGWGTWDLLGGGLISDLAKHSHLDDAQAEIEHTQHLLRRFKTELTDIQISSEITMATGGFAKFADFFFDGLIADWFMQSKIRQSQDSISRVGSEVAGILQKLRYLQDQENARLAKLDAAMNAKIINA